MQNQKLYAVLLGGRAEGCHIELHDVVFVVCSSITEAYPKLVKKWFGTHHRLHIDSYVELSYVDGHKVVLSKEPSDKSNNKHLYFTNFGAYTEGVWGEIHEANFYVGESKKDIIKRAKQELCCEMYLQHCDDNVLIGGANAHKDIDDLIDIACVDGFYIALEPTEQKQDLVYHSNYIKLDVPDILKLVNLEEVGIA